MRESAAMATYIYETTDETKPARRFEIQHSMKDEPLTKHPETGEPIRRVITGGFGYMGKGNPPRHADMQRNMGGGSCGTGCGCH
jgi:predicted nucleic acid-binding Zn ribbon protein